MLPNAIYEYPKTEKRNPFTLTLDDTRNLQITSPKELCQKIEGIFVMLLYIFNEISFHMFPEEHS